ncbi:MAG: tetratricopeptide repeat protein [Sphingomonadales bacterium]|nr:MAG: tetratricopeptide repeat protein [Sphingomonadales bacterium]
MKITSTTALAIALALGVAGGAGTAPAFAKDKKEEAKAPNYNLSKPVRESLAKAQTALTAGDNATAATEIANARAAAKTEDDKFLSSQMLYNLSQKTNDPKQRDEAMTGMLAGNRLPPETRTQVLLQMGQTAAQAGDVSRAQQYLGEVIKTDPNNNDAYALLAEAQVKAGKPQEAIATFQQAMDHAKQTGQKLPANWYGRAVNIAYTAKLPDQTEAITRDWLGAYPTKDNWRDSLVIWRDLHKIDNDTEIDLMRLWRTTGSLKGAADYMDYVNAVYLRNPGEAKGVLDEGVKANYVNLASNQNAREINGIVASKMAGDKASLTASATQAKGPKGTAKLAVNVGDGYLGYEMWPQAIEMYKLALSKGGADANLINTRLGMALARSGDKEGAKAAFAQVTGPRTGLAKYWLIYLDQGSPAAA